jgi:hypothetical protein
MKWCRIVKLGWLLGSEGWGARAWQRHVARCAECRQALEREGALTEALRRSAPPVATELPPFLKARILANLGPARTARATASRIGWHRLQPWAVAGIALVLLVSLWPRRGWELTETGGSMSPPLVVEGPLDASAAPGWFDSGRVTQWVELAGQPLHGELENAVDDGRKLLAVALYSVVPDATAEQILAQAENWIGSER